MNFIVANNVARALFLCVCCVLMASCTQSNGDNDECPVTVDSVEIIDSKMIGETTYYLVYRVSGWHDKTEILELYNDLPTFDRCSQSNLEPIYGDSLEMEQSVSHLYFDPTVNKIEIEYLDSEPDRDHNKNIKIEVTSD
ncbi:MAG: hypothetical protein L3J28_13390 [Candidatus Polarisedimenticolaceae bacterium]|nr:hypothetical protein [Candidatus Polarisedimenticolaceae bacterium]